eukprot:NODE_7747_length_256_cov_0.980676_g7132_i0.p2 GENE.NODE_7747_length_256_cov_0.980676_g7132_i0~~NODE_7747_length_256_cov_0.980676_g7132_i0.p2  ORF type:complete len:56 (+),score=6.51 NODE_7747_length_256_cov_0.980676_g7132_i0:9-176(+)
MHETQLHHSIGSILQLECCGGVREQLLCDLHIAKRERRWQGAAAAGRDQARVKYR